ncbi:MAG TPA: hypothetical protein V6D11_03850 [Waterburya sp.]|jgi:hypothetical protein
MLFTGRELTDKDTTSACKLLELFAQGIHTHQISFTDWYELLTTPLDGSFSREDEDLLVRLIYAVRQGWVKVIDTD